MFATSHQVPNVTPPTPVPSCQHVTSGPVPSTTSHHVPHVTPRPPRHVISPTPNHASHVPSRPTSGTSHHVPTSRHVTHVSSRSHVTSLPHGTSLHHVTSYPHVTSYLLVTSRPHVTSCPSPDPTSRQVPLLTSGPPRHVMFTTSHHVPHVMSCPPRPATSLTFHHVLTSRTSHVTLRPLRDGLHHVPSLRHAPPHFPHVMSCHPRQITPPTSRHAPTACLPCHVTSRHVTSRSHVSYYVPPQHFTSCSHVTSRPYVTPHHPRKITSLTSQHVLTSRTSPRHATSPLNITPTSRHVTSPTSCPHVTSRHSRDVGDVT
jgi:hypothetical protein